MKKKRVCILIVLTAMVMGVNAQAVKVLPSGITNFGANVNVAGRTKTNELHTDRVAHRFGDGFTYDGKILEHYSVGWYMDSWTNQGPSLWQSAWGGNEIFYTRRSSYGNTF